MFRLWGKIWKSNHLIKDTDFKRHSKTRFYQDSFIEQIEFDYLEIQVIEED